MRPSSVILISGLLTAIHAFNLSVLFPPSVTKIDKANVTLIQDELGYFHEVDIEKVINEPTPDFIPHKDVHFELFTPKNPKEAQIIQSQNASELKSTNFNKNLPTRLMIHGWYSQGVLTSQFADAYFEKGQHNLNFIAVNWQKGSDVRNYIVARRRVEMVAEFVAKFVDFLVESGGLKLKDLTIIGHSLGAHISGIVGKKVTKGRLPKIVALDPALPLFKFENVDERLADTDADHVEVVHSCAGIVAFSQALGTADFYPNGGRAQPGCGWDITGVCSHQRAYHFYLESIYNPQFYAVECDSFENLQKGNCSIVNQMQLMGGEPGKNTRAKGIYYLKTNEEKLYAQGRHGIVKSVMESLNYDEEKNRIWELFSSVPLVTRDDDMETIEQTINEMANNTDTINNNNTGISIVDSHSLMKYEKNPGITLNTIKSYSTSEYVYHSSASFLTWFNRQSENGTGQLLTILNTKPSFWTSVPYNGYL